MVPCGKNVVFLSAVLACTKTTTLCMWHKYTDLDVNTSIGFELHSHKSTTFAGAAKPDVIVVSFPETYTPRVLVEVKEEEPEEAKKVDILSSSATTEKERQRKARALERMQSYLEIVS